LLGFARWRRRDGWPVAAKVAGLGNCFYIAAVHRGLDPQMDGIDGTEFA
jgi:hypothetical protein